MTGSSLVPVIIPIVVAASLATWLIMVFRAGSHPRYRHHAGSAPQPGEAGMTPAAARPQIPQPRAAPMEKVPAGRGQDAGPVCLTQAPVGGLITDAARDALALAEPEFSWSGRCKYP